MVREQSAAVGVEIGSSRATIAIIDEEGQVRERFAARTLRGRPARATLEPYLRAIDVAVERAVATGCALQGIGLALPGRLDQTCRRPFLIPILPSLNHFPLAELLEARYRLPVLLQSDVDAAALGEYRFGAGQARGRLLLLTVQAVVGAALISDGRPEPAAREYTGHVCHLEVATSGPRCSCGRRGCISTLVSLEALQRLIQRAVRRGEQTSLIRRLSCRESLSPQLLAEEARQGDRVARGIYEEVGHWLGVAAARYRALFAPELLILGDGIVSADDLLVAEVRKSAAAQEAAGQAVAAVNPLEIVAARLGQDAALIGSVAPFFARATSVAAAGPPRQSRPSPVAESTATGAAEGHTAAESALRPQAGPGKRRRYYRPSGRDDLASLVAEHAPPFAPHAADDLEAGPLPGPLPRRLREGDQ
jgi:glucokinase